MEVYVLLDEDKDIIEVCDCFDTAKVAAGNYVHKDDLIAWIPDHAPDDPWQERRGYVNDELIFIVQDHVLTTIEDALEKVNGGDN